MRTGRECYAIKYLYIDRIVCALREVTQRHAAIRNRETRGSRDDLTSGTATFLLQTLYKRKLFAVRAFGMLREILEKLRAAGKEGGEGVVN